jgi:hypothetical protein
MRLGVSGQEQMMMPSTPEVAPAPDCTVHWVEPLVIVPLLIVAVYPLVVAVTVPVFPVESE